MISYHIVASVSAAQRVDMARQAGRRRLTSEGRVVRKRVRRQVRLPRFHPRDRAMVGPAPFTLPGLTVPSSLPAPRRAGPMGRLVRFLFAPGPDLERAKPRARV